MGPVPLHPSPGSAAGRARINRLRFALALIATPISMLATCCEVDLPMLPASPPTKTGKSGPIRKNRKARLNRTATKSRRAITHAASKKDRRELAELVGKATKKMTQQILWFH